VVVAERIFPRQQVTVGAEREAAAVLADAEVGIATMPAGDLQGAGLLEADGAIAPPHAEGAPNLCAVVRAHADGAMGGGAAKNASEWRLVGVGAAVDDEAFGAVTQFKT
jgi:hypothetical protein